MEKRFDIQSAFQASYTFYDLGYNLRPTEITGFLGQYQMQFYKRILKLGNKILRRYKTPLIKTLIFFLDFKHMNLVSGFAFLLFVKTLI
jgi:CDP-6-deoxy-D-xylo-4-hexulose-3-dehydrase